MNHITYNQFYRSFDLEKIGFFLSRFDSSYSLATRLFPQKIREATTILYAFVRYADELIDNPELDFPGKSHHTLEAFIDNWNHILECGIHEEDKIHPVLRSFYFLIEEYAIPHTYVHDFLMTMQSDAKFQDFEMYRDLEGYMWGSATVVGYIMMYIIGYSSDKAFEHARALAEAMQLANFLRDIEEDSDTRNRTYLAKEDMYKYGVTESMIREKKFTPELDALIREYWLRADILFTKGRAGIYFLNRSGRLPVLISAYLYREYLILLQKKGYNPFGKRLKISLFKKLILVLRACFDFFTQRYDSKF
jgi:15-cis-phytoene synthase